MNSMLAEHDISTDDSTGAFRKRRSTVKTTPEMTKARNERLIRAIKAKAKSYGYENRTLAEMFGMEYSQLNACYAGVRDFAYLTPNQRQRIANFLDVPPIQVHLWCGLVQPTDFVSENDYKKKLDHIYKNHILTDPMLCQIVLEEDEWAALSEKAKLSFVLFYMAYTGSWLFNAAQAAMNPAVGKVAAKKKEKASNKAETTTQDAPASTTVATNEPSNTAQTPEQALVQAHAQAATAAPEPMQAPEAPEAPIISAASAEKARSLVNSVMEATAKEMAANDALSGQASKDASAKTDDLSDNKPNSSGENTAAGPEGSDSPLITRRPRRIKITTSNMAGGDKLIPEAGTATTRTLKVAPRPVEKTSGPSEEELIKMWPMTANMKPEDRRRFVAIAEQALREQSENTA